MEIRAIHWMAALGFSAALHMLIAYVIYAPGGAGTRGYDGVSVQLGSAAATATALETPMESALDGSGYALTSIQGGSDVMVAPPRPTHIPDALDAADTRSDVTLAPQVEDVELAAETIVPHAAAGTIKANEVVETELAGSIVRSRSGSAVPAADPVAYSGGNTGRSASHPQGVSDDGGSGPTQDYYADLATWLSKHKRYPSRAKRSGQEGIVEIEFVIDKDGRLLDHRIVSSSGFRMLDDEAYAMVQRAAPMPPIPGDLAMDELSVTAPISFSLR